jgi:hypothetical protein
MKKLQELTRKIRSVLEGRASQESVTTLADSFAGLCRQAEARLVVVITMLDKRNDYQALQSAEQEPALLDFIGALSFGGEMDWQHYCEKNGLTVAPRLDARAVQRVMALYENPITAKHPLYKDFRSAMLERDDEKALRTVKTILKLNPGDETARRERKRLENKQFQVVVERIRESLQNCQYDNLAELVEMLEAMASAEKLDRVEVYEQARSAVLELKRRLAEKELPGLVEEMKKQRDCGDWRGVGAGLDRWNQFCQEAGGIAGDASLVEVMRELAAYHQKQHSAHLAELSFENAFKSFMLFVEEIETRLLTSSGFTKEEIQDKEEVFARRWKELESFGRPVPSDLLQRIKAAGAGLKSQVESMQKTRRMKLGGITVAAIAAMLSIAAVSWHAWKAYKLSTDLDGFQQQAQCSPAEQLISSLKTEESLLLRWPYLQSRVEQVDAWTKQARSTESQANAALDSMSRVLVEKSAAAQADQVMAQMRQTEAIVKEVCRDLANPLAHRLEDLRVKLGLLMNELLQKRVTESLAEIENAETFISRNFSFESPANKLDDDLKTVLRLLQPLEKFTKEKNSELKLPEDLVLRISAARKKHDEYAKELELLKAAKVSLREAGSYEAYLKALRSWQGLRFVEAAPAIKRLDSLPEEKSILAQILTSGDERILKAVEEDSAGSALLPNEPTDSDLEALVELQDDLNLNEVFENQVMDYSKGGTRRTIWSQGALQSKSFGAGMVFSGKCYDPESMHANSVYFAQVDLYPRLVGGTRMGIEVMGSSSRLSSTSQMMNALKLREMTDDNGKYFRRSVLELIEKVVRQQDASPLARAYLIQELYDFAMPREFAWGLHLCTSLKADLNEMKTLIGDNYLSSDSWLSKKVSTSMEPRLKEFFSKIQGRAYFKEAQAKRQLLLPVIRAGLKFGGHIDLDGIAQLTLSARTSPELWYLKEDNVPALIIKDVAAGGQSANLPIKPADAQLLGPVFFIPLDRKGLIEAYQSSLNPSQKSQVQNVRESYFLSPTGP